MNEEWVVVCASSLPQLNHKEISKISKKQLVELSRSKSSCNYLRKISAAKTHGHHNRAATGVVLPGALHADLQTHKQDNSENLTHGSITTSSAAQQQRISNPLAVDNKRDQYLKSQTASDKAAMEVQTVVVKQLEAQLESSARSSLSGESGVGSLLSVHSSGSALQSKASNLDTSMDSACFLEEKRDCLAGLPPSNHVLSSSFMPKHRKNESLGGLNRLEAAKKDSSLLRSHSDSFKRNRKEAASDSLRQGNSSDDLSNVKLAPMLAAKQAVRKRHAEGRGRLDADNSENSSDSAIDQISPASDRNSAAITGSSSSSSLNACRNKDIMAIDDQEFESEEENFDVPGGPFSDFIQLLQQPAHLAVFLHYVISNCDPAPLLFYLITETYPQGSCKEMRKWAYEIFSTFLVDKAPLKINVDEQTVESIHIALVNKHDKEEVMKNLFSQLRMHAPPVIKEMMADFRSKQVLGLGSIYGDHELKDTLDLPQQVKVIESSLWKHFERFMNDEEDERSAAMASALAFFFKHFGYTNTKNNLLLERCSAFNTKEKTKFQMFGKQSKKAVFQRGHNLLPQQYFVVTNCVVCQGLLCGVGCQGFQCQKCELNFHKSCLENIREPCTGKKALEKPKPQTRPPPAAEKPKPQTTNMFGSKIKLMRKPSSLASSTSSSANVRDQHQTEEGGLASNAFIRADAQNEEVDQTKEAPSVPSRRVHDRVDQPKSADDTKSSPTNSRSRSPEEMTSADDSQFFVYSDNVVPEHSFKPSAVRAFENGLLIDASVHGAQMSFDSDFETETDLPSLDSVIPKEQLKKMKPKEKKRQEVINELFYTERAHVRNLKVMHRLFYQPMHCDQPPEFVDLLFPNLAELIEVHGNLNKEFKQKRRESENAVVGDISAILVKHFSGEMGERFKNVCGKFCEKQSQAQEVLKVKQRKEPKLANLLQEAASNSLCRRLELKDLLPTAVQRLTKYPLLIENLLKYTQADEENQALQIAYQSSKDILNSVNKAVQAYENHLKLVELKKKLDKRPIENSDNPVVVEYKNLELTRHVLLYDGPLTWRVSRDRLLNVHVVLLADILLLLQKQDDKLVLRCQSTLIAARREDTKMTHSPIIKLTQLLIKPVATDKCAFFLVSTSEVGPQIYDLVAATKEEKNKWCRHISEAVETFKKTNPSKATVTSSKSVAVHPRASHKMTAMSDNTVSQSQVHDTEGISQESLDTLDNEDLQSDKQELARNEELVITRQRSSSYSASLDQVRDLDESIHKMLLQKRELLSRIGYLPEEDSDFVLNMPVLPDDSEKDSDLKDELQMMLTSSSCLAQHINNLLRPDEAVTDFDELPPPVPPRSPNPFSEMNLVPPPLPPRLYKAMPRIPILQLTDYCLWMSNRLTHMMKTFERAEEERKLLLDQLQSAQEQLSQGLNKPLPDDLAVSLVCKVVDEEEVPICLEDINVQSISVEAESQRRVSGEDKTLDHIHLDPDPVVSDEPPLQNFCAASLLEAFNADTYVDSEEEHGIRTDAKNVSNDVDQNIFHDLQNDIATESCTDDCTLDNSDLVDSTLCKEIDDINIVDDVTVLISDSKEISTT